MATWAELDEVWRAKEERSLREREENAAAAREGRAIPHLNAFWLLDSTKVPVDASPEEITHSYREFIKICRKPTRKRFTI